MARFTSIGMPKKTFVASAAEEAQIHGAVDTEPEPSKAGNGESDQPGPKKRKRRGTRGKVISEPGNEVEQPQKKGWGRDPNLAKRTKLSMDHSAQRREKRQQEKHNDTTCFACRSVGHAARDCPNVLLALEQGVEGAAAMLGDGAKDQEDGKSEAPKKGMKRKQGKKGGDLVGGRCYRCNGTDHSLGACQEPVDPTNPTPFATCYICLGTGHLSSLCPSNQKGIYVNGGCCKVCKSTAHRAKDCPEESEAKKAEWAARPKRGEILLGTSDGARMGADEDDFMVDSRRNLRGQGKRGKHAPNNNGVRGLYMGKQRDLPVEGSATLLEPAQPALEPVATPVVKTKKKVIAF